MSLINDALRRANQAKKNPPDGADQTILQPIEPQKSKSNFTPLILFALACIALIAAGWFFWSALREKQSNQTDATPIAPPVVSRENFSAPKPESISAPPEFSAQTDTNSAVTNPVEVAAPIANTNADLTNTVPPPPAPPVLKLQGVFLHTGKSVALINGKTLENGDTISGARITKISKDEVMLDWNGTTIRLELP